MFRALLSHRQEALHIQQLVYFVCIVSAGWTGFHSDPGSSQPTQYAQNIPIVYAVPPGDEQIVLETCRGC
jgi:hypothetical protein